MSVLQRCLSYRGARYERVDSTIRESHLQTPVGAKEIFTLDYTGEYRDNHFSHHSYCECLPRKCSAIAGLLLCAGYQRFSPTTVGMTSGYTAVVV